MSLSIVSLLLGYCNPKDQQEFHLKIKNKEISEYTVDTNSISCYYDETL